MNKFVYLLASSAVVATTLGQSINLNNRGLALVNDASGNPLTGTSYVAQVWYGASAGSLDKSFAPSPFRAPTTLYKGTWNPAAVGGPGNTATLDGFKVPDNTADQTAFLQVAVWDTALYSSWSAAKGNAGTGLSEVFTYTISKDPIALPGGMENMKSFSLSGSTPVVPEPTTIALGALGAAALLWRRRK